MINITLQQFNPNTWNHMMISAADSRNQQYHKHICKVIYPDETCTLELKTDQEIQEHSTKYGRWKAMCVKMDFTDIINITRITSLNYPVNVRLKDPLKESLILMASRAEQKYESGFLGVVRKIISIFFNLFTTDAVGLFGMPQTDLDFVISNSRHKHQLPLFIGDNSKFAHLVEQGL